LSKVIKTNELEEEEYKSFSLKSFHTGTAKKNKKALKAAGIYYDLNDEDINSVQKLFLKAKKDADKIINDARLEAEKIKSVSHKKGYEEGKAEGIKNADNRFDSAVNALKITAADIQNKKDNFAIEHQDTLIRLSLSIAKKIIRQEMTVDKEFVINTIKTAVKMTMDREKLKIRVNQDDLEICNQKKPEIMRDIDGIKSIEMISDIAVGKGGVIVEYALGEIDARIEKQFNEIETEIIDNL